MVMVWFGAWVLGFATNEQVLGQLSQVTDHVRVIQETTITTNELLKYRIEEAFTDIQRLVVGVLSRASGVKRSGVRYLGKAM